MTNAVFSAIICQSMANHGNVIISFDEVSFAYDQNKPILAEASFSVRENAKFTIMGQNGAGKSTIFKLITKDIKPDNGQANTSLGASIAIATQVMKAENLDKTVEEFFGPPPRDEAPAGEVPSSISALARFKIAPLPDA